jgi:SAM-dependent methyltransferase
MTTRQQISRQMGEHYETVWQGRDAWDLENSAFEQRRFARLLQCVGGRRYQRVLEIGCGSGCFTRLLAGIADHVVGIDIAPAAIERARARVDGAGPCAITLQAVDIMEFDLSAGGPWDLAVFSETIYCLGWLYPLFDVAWLAARLFQATRVGGRLLLTNTYGREHTDWLQRPWLIDTYRDLFRNVGYRIETEEVFQGNKDGVDFKVLISLLAR